jgi:hypothetical protein
MACPVDVNKTRLPRRVFCCGQCQNGAIKGVVMNDKPDPSQSSEELMQPAAATQPPVPYVEPTPTPTADLSPDESSSQTASGDVPTQDYGDGTPMLEFGLAEELSIAEWRNSGVAKLVRREIRVLRATLSKKEKIEDNYNDERVKTGRLTEKLDAEIRVNKAITRGQNVSEIGLSLCFLVAGILGSDGYSAKDLVAGFSFYFFAVAIAVIGVAIRLYAAGSLKKGQESK